MIFDAVVYKNFLQVRGVSSKRIDNLLVIEIISTYFGFLGTKGHHKLDIFPIDKGIKYICLNSINDTIGENKDTVNIQKFYRKN